MVWMTHAYADSGMQASDTLWNELEAAGLAEHDRFWRLPLDDEYSPQISESNADLCNVSTLEVCSERRI